MNPLLNNLTPAQKQAIMRQQAPMPPNVEHYKILACPCGSLELESVPYKVMRHDPFDPKRFALVGFERHRCIACKLYPVFDDGEWKWQKEPRVTQAE